MRRRRGLLAVTLAVTAVLGAPHAAEAQVPAGDSVSGRGIAEFFGPFAIDARSGPSGENPAGQASFDTEETSISGSVSCLSVQGRVGRFTIDLGRFFTVRVEVVDNAGLGTPDVIAADITLGGSPQDCSPLIQPARTGAVLSGDIVVVDTPRLPTAKQQCKDGGWRNYGVFRNQGDCVSFVTTQGRNTPGT